MSVTFTHTPNWYCLYVRCPNCPYREGYLCLYDEKNIMDDIDEAIYN